MYNWYSNHDPYSMFSQYVYDIEKSLYDASVVNYEASYANSTFLAYQNNAISYRQGIHYASCNLDTFYPIHSNLAPSLFPLATGCKY